jgi:hypothetical protein
LSRQVAEAIRILDTKDQILNSKNEYMANCLTRICVEEERYERKKRERQEEELEEEEKQRLLSFKNKHRRPKRGRADIQEKPVEPSRKRVKVFQKAGNPPVDSDMNLGVWLNMAEMRCLRVGELRRRLEIERAVVLEKMKIRKTTLLEEKHPDRGGGDQESVMVDTVLCDEPSTLLEESGDQESFLVVTVLREEPSTLQKSLLVDTVLRDEQSTLLEESSIQVSVLVDTVLCDEPSTLLEDAQQSDMGLTLEEAVLEQPEATPSIPKVVVKTIRLDPRGTGGADDQFEGVGGQHHQHCEEKRKERKKKQEKGYCLTSYSAWWKIIEKEENKFYREVEKERLERKKKQVKNEIKRTEKENFVRKFFPE